MAPSMAEPSDKYLETLKLYYEEEVEGEAFFTGVADRLADPDQKAKMYLMAKVENYAAAAVFPLLQKYDLTPRSRSELTTSGQHQARSASDDWSLLIDGMRKTFPGYIDDFKGLENMAPEHDLPRLKILTAHEIAAIAFLEAEAANHPDSGAAMRRYLRTGTA